MRKALLAKVPVAILFLTVDSASGIGIQSLNVIAAEGFRCQHKRELKQTMSTKVLMSQTVAMQVCSKSKIS